MADRVVHVEDVASAVDEAFVMIRDRAARLRAAHGDRVYTTLATKPDITGLLGDALRSALEDEIVPATETVAGKGIVAWELEREVIKKALVGLRRDELRKIAKDHRLDIRGNTEDLAATIARAYRWDEEQIARLVLAHEPEPVAERGHVTRLVALTTVPNMDDVDRRLGYVTGRYIRVAVARWFVFDDFERGGDRLELHGRVRSYQASVDERTEAPHLARTQSEDQVVIRLHEGSTTVEITGASAIAARSAMRALELTTDMTGLGYVPFRQNILPGVGAGFASESLFLLDVLYNRLPNAGLQDRNLTIARFKVGEATVQDEITDDLVRRPRLRAVRFEGDHLLDNVPACRLIATEHRALVDISLTATTSGDETQARFPLRIGIDRDQVIVMTGFGTAKPELSASIHVALRQEVVEELEQGFADPQRLARFAAEIHQRSQESGEITEATMLEDEDPDNT